MFFGTFEHAIDDKGRVSVPVKFRDVLRGLGDERLFVTNFVFQGEHCLDVFTAQGWLQLQEKVREKPQFDPRVISFFQNFYFAGAQELSLDKQGRVLLPPRLRDYAGIRRDLVFVGALDKFRIWDGEVWGRIFTSGERMLVENPNMLTEIGV